MVVISMYCSKIEKCFELNNNGKFFTIASNSNDYDLEKFIEGYTIQLIIEDLEFVNIEGILKTYNTLKRLEYITQNQWHIINKKCSGIYFIRGSGACKTDNEKKFTITTMVKYFGGRCEIPILILSCYTEYQGLMKKTIEYDRSESWYKRSIFVIGLHIPCCIEC